MPIAAWKTTPHKKVVLTLTVLVVLYAVAVALGWMTPALGEHADHAPAEDVAHVWAVMPFVLLLAAIAVLPLVPWSAHWWEHNHHKLYVAGSLALVTLIYIALAHPNGGGIAAAYETLEHVTVVEYVPFIILLFSLYTISGGIRIEGDLPAHALTNTTFIAAGGLLASLIGTTGAAMLLMRPLLDTNSERKHVAHTVVFFIFVVCNCGGLLLPIGDPPLFLGYLNGVGFLWTLSLWKSWLFVNGTLLAVYFLVDHFFYYPHETKADIAIDERARSDRLKFSGVWPNALLLVGVVLSVALLDPAQPLPRTDWHPWLYLREMTQLALVAVSLLFGSPSVREANSFDYVADRRSRPRCSSASSWPCSRRSRFSTPAAPVWASTRRKSSFGPPAGCRRCWTTRRPTWCSSRPAKAFRPMRPAVAGVAEPLLAGISSAPVTMGAMTYIGNGPNFMVKTIAEKARVPMPSFFGYMIYSLLILLPILAVNSWLFID